MLGKQEKRLGPNTPCDHCEVVAYTQWYEGNKLVSTLCKAHDEEFRGVSKAQTARIKAELDEEREKLRCRINKARSLEGPPVPDWIRQRALDLDKLLARSFN